MKLANTAYVRFGYLKAVTTKKTSAIWRHKIWETFTNVSKKTIASIYMARETTRCIEELFQIYGRFPSDRKASHLRR
jgi:hypothetical protein